jgi:hypothetical protein
MICHHRSVENPDVAIETDIRFCPARRGSSGRELSVLHQDVDARVSPITTAHVKSWRRRVSVIGRLLELRRQTLLSRSIQDSMVSQLPHQILSTATCRAIRETFLGATNNESGLRSQENALDAHFRIIEESVQAAVLNRTQQEQQRREQAIQGEVVAEEARHLQRLQIQEDEDQSSQATVTTVEKSNENSPVLIGT